MPPGQVSMLTPSPGELSFYPGYCFFCNAPVPTAIHTLSLHDALPIYAALRHPGYRFLLGGGALSTVGQEVLAVADSAPRSEEHTSELQSRQYLVCRLLLEKKNESPQAARCLEDAVRAGQARRPGTQID